MTERNEKELGEKRRRKTENKMKSFVSSITDRQEQHEGDEVEKKKENRENLYRKHVISSVGFIFY